VYPAAEPEPTPAQPTAEEIAAPEAEFVDSTAQGLNVDLTEEQMDTVLAGGKDAVALLTNLRGGKAD